MERTIKLFFITVLMLVMGSIAVFAEDGMPLSTLVTPQSIDYNICTRNYILTPEKLFYMALASINANRFTIDEMQSKTGYILFTAVNKQYLASVVKVDTNKSMLRITPTNNNYFFAPGIVLNVFRYIDLNGATPVYNLVQR